MALLAFHTLFDTLYSVAQCGIVWHSMALLSGTLPGERRRPGWQEQQAVAARPTGLQEWTHQDPQWTHPQATVHANFLTQLETIETETKRDETDRLVILSVNTLLSVESFSQAVDRHVLPSPKMIWP